MRTVQHSDVLSANDHPHKMNAQIRSISRYGGQSTPLLLATVTVVAYITGIIIEKSFAPGFLAGEVQYYLEAASYSSYLRVFFRMQVAAFFQLTLILFFGFHLLGSVLSALFCAIQGMIFGLCMAGVAYHGGKMLIWFWLINGAYIICHTVNSLWLCTMAKRSGTYLFCKVLNQNVPQTTNHPPYRLKYMLIRYIASLLLSLLYSAAGALIAILFAGVLL